MKRLGFATLLPPVTLLVVTAFLPGSIPAARAGALPVGMAQKLDPRLVTPFTQSPDDTVSIWIEFADKGVRDGHERIESLAAAEAALSPRARARRMRAGVRPLVDELDLPLHPPYLADLAAHGFTPYASSRWFNRVAVRVPARLLADLGARPFVSRLAPVERGRASRPPPHDSAEPGASARPARVGALDYGLTGPPLTQIGVPALHDSGYTGAGVLVAVLDAGFNFFDKHEALRDHVIPPERQRDFPRGIHDVQDTTNISGFSHGTWVLGCLAGRKAGTYMGAAFGAEYALARTEVTSSESHQEMVYWGMAAEWADSLGADIISSSLGYSTFDSDPDYGYADMDGHTTIVSRAAQVAASKGILVVNSVGNEGSSQWHFLVAPADVNGDSLIAVGAVNASGAPAGFSSFGPSADGRIKPDLAACGVLNFLVSASGNPNAYVTQSGTSFSTPLVAGLAACLMQARPQRTPVEVIAALRATASRASNPDDRVGYGIPNGGAALCLGSQGAAGAPWARLGLAGSNPVNLGLQPARFTFEFSTGTVPSRPGVVRVFDAGGRRVRELWSGVVPCPVPMTLFWDGLDDDGRPCGAGLYFIQLSAGDQKAGLRITGLR